MMPGILLPVPACLLLSIGAYAQSWFPTAAEWYYRFIPSGTNAVGHVRILCNRDTTVDGTSARVLEVYQTLGVSEPPYAYSTTRKEDRVVTEQNGIVYLYNTEDEAFDTLYHMAAAPGESWHFPRLSPAWLDCDTTGLYTVQDTGTRIIDGVALRWLAVDLRFHVGFGPTGYYHVPDTIVERLGALGSYFYPQDHCASMMDWNTGGPLTCYFDTEISHGPGAPADPACAYLPNGMEELRTASIQVFPNPTTDRIGIAWATGNAPFAAELIDMAGRVVRQWPMDGHHGGAGWLPLDGIADGRYTLLVRWKEGMARAPVIVAR